MKTIFKYKGVTYRAVVWEGRLCYNSCSFSPTISSDKKVCCIGCNNLARKGLIPNCHEDYGKYNDKVMFYDGKTLNKARKFIKQNNVKEKLIVLV